MELTCLLNETDCILSSLNTNGFSSVSQDKIQINILELALYNDFLKLQYVMKLGNLLPLHVSMSTFQSKYISYLSDEGHIYLCVFINRIYMYVKEHSVETQ